jgi:hydroxymethylglutaryl-CoA reductase
MSSRLSGFYRKSLEQRHELVLDNSPLSDADIEQFDASALSQETASLMIENVIGTFALPLAVGVNFTCNNRDYLVPMVVEEPSILAAVSNMSKLVRPHGGFTATSDESVMIAQVQISNVTDPESTIERLSTHKDELTTLAQSQHPRLIERGGGLRDITFRTVVYDEPDCPVVTMVVIHFEIDCVDAMGANMVNTVAEFVSPRIEEITGYKVNLRILSNYATKRLTSASCRIPVKALGSDGMQVAEGIVDAYRFAYADPWRAATHNKGIMNGIDPVVIATGNDWRAIEAGAHAWASRSGQYRSLTRWWIADDHLHGQLTLPMQIGTVGGCIRNHPQVQTNLKLLGNPRARELSEIMVAIGLAQNLGALKALATEGIQRGHMRMHARNVAVEVGATLEEVPAVVQELCKAHVFSTTKAKDILELIRQ